MSRIDFSFDWKGFKVSACIAIVVVLAGGALRYGMSRLSPAPATTPVVATSNAPEIAPRAGLDYQMPLREIRALAIADVIPKQGKFIAADLVNMQLDLYQDGELVAQYPIKTKGRPGTPWETPAGLYKIQSKERDHFSSIGKVYMPYSMQFYGNYFIHGWTYYPDGTPTPFTFSGGCIKLDTDNAAKVFDFADVGTPVFVYDSKQTAPPPPLFLGALPLPSVLAGAWLVADLDTGDVLAEQGARLPENPEYAGTLMAALVANETISLDKEISVPEGALFDPPDVANAAPKTFFVDDLFYPLLLQPNNEIVNALTSYHGTRSFIRSMNAAAAALDMASTTFAAVNSPESTTTAEDLYRLAWYLENKKSFVLKIAATRQKTITAIDDSAYDIAQTPSPATIAIVEIPGQHRTRHVVVITLDSPDSRGDSVRLSDWISRAARNGSEAACASCAAPHYRTIEL